MAVKTPQHRPYLVQAPVKALDPDGTAVITTGTAGFAVASLICLWQGDHLAARGELWHLWVAFTGLGLGLGATATSWRSHFRRKKATGLDQEPAAGN